MNLRLTRYWVELRLIRKDKTQNIIQTLDAKHYLKKKKISKKVLGGIQRGGERKKPKQNKKKRVHTHTHTYRGNERE